MSSIDGLEVYLGIPVWIEDDNNVSLMKVNTKAASSSWEYEELLVWIRVLEVINSILTVISWGLPVNSTELKSPESKKVVKNVQ